MAVQQNAINHAQAPPSSKVGWEIFLHWWLSGASSPDLAILLQQQLSDLFACGGFLLRKWNLNDPSVLQSIPEELRDVSNVQTISKSNEYTKTLGVKWNVSTNQFCITISNLPPPPAV